MKPEAIVARTDLNQKMTYYQPKEMKKEKETRQDSQDRFHEKENFVTQKI